MHRLLIAFAAALACPVAAAADVTATGFVVRHERVIHAAPARVYDALVHDVGRWWNSQHTYSGNSANLAIDARPGGCFCERLPSGGVEHLRVVYVKPNDTLRLAGGLGPLQAFGVAGAMTWHVVPADNDTKLELTYSVGGFIPGGPEKMARPVEQMLGEQVDRLKQFVESGSPEVK